MSVKKIRVSEAIMYKCREFAELCVVTNIAAYKRRNQSDPKKIIEQIVTGKVAEFGVAEALGYGEPDLKIYATKDKTYDADLAGDGKLVHVKGQSAESAAKYGESWSFSVWDSLITKPKPEDYIALCITDGPLVDFYGLWQMEAVKALLREPVVFQLRASKRVLYYDDLLKFEEK